MCALIVKLIENGNPATGGRDKITLKAEIESPLVIRRNPTIIPLAGGEIVGIDLGKNVAGITISGVVDYEITELFVDTIAGTVPFIANEAIVGNSAWDNSTSPTRAATPTATILAGIPNLTAPTSLVVSSVTKFFVDNEAISTTRGAGEATAVVNEPFPDKRRLEHIARFWYTNGVMTLITRSGEYSVFINSMDFTMMAGLEDRYNFKISFSEAVQGLSQPA